MELSVCIITYNHEKYIKQCLESIYAQETDFDFEIIISDDHSSDNTVSEIKKIADERVFINVQDENRGISRNLYDALHMAKGKYIYAFSGDDWLIDNYAFKYMHEFLEYHKDCVSVSNWVKVADKNGNFTGDTKTTEKSFCSLKDFYFGNPLGDYGMFRNIFKDGKDEWLYKCNPRSNEPQFGYYILKNGKSGNVNRYVSAYRSFRDDESTNFNSLYSWIDWFEMSAKALDYIERNVDTTGLTKYRKAVLTYRYFRNSIHLMRTDGQVKEFIRFMKCISKRDFIRMLFFMPMFIYEEGYYSDRFMKRKYRKAESS